MEWYLKVLRQYADFSGRARRKEYWMFALFNVIFMFIAMSIDRLFGTSSSSQNFGLISGIYNLAIIIPSIAVSVRRLHDINKSGWMLLVNFAPLIGTIWLLILFIREGDSGINSYGLDPKNEYPQ